MERLEEEQEREQRHELGREIVSAKRNGIKIMQGKMATEVSKNYLLEDGEGEAGLGDGVPGSLHQMLEFRRPKLTEEDFSHEFPHQDDHDEGLEVYDGHAGVGLGDVDHGGVELLSLHPGIDQHQTSEEHAGPRQHSGSHHSDLKTGGQAHSLRIFGTFSKIITLSLTLNLF